MIAEISRMSTADLMEAVRILVKIYDVVRVVDPVQNEVILFTNQRDTMPLREKACYGFWQKDKFCDNCISLRAVTERDTFFKIETKEERMYLITANPVEYNNTSLYVIETLSDITGKGLVESITGWENEDSKNLIKRFNDALVRDELTQIFNRRYINERLPVEILQSIASQRPAALIMADIDQFKSKNDEYGHIAGDRILQQFACLLAAGVRNDKDWVARYGGEEFLLYLHNTDSQQALEVAERVRKMTEEAEFAIQAGTVNITCSFGICLLQKEMDMQAWIDCADKKLYAAKSSGGNRILI